jgi:hypothetical protein
MSSLLLGTRTSTVDYRAELISNLPVIAMSVRQMLAGAKDQYRTLTACQPAPHVFDDDLLDRLLAFYEEQRTDVAYFSKY